MRVRGWDCEAQVLRVVLLAAWGGEDAAVTVRVLVMGVAC